MLFSSYILNRKRHNLLKLLCSQHDLIRSDKSTLRGLDYSVIYKEMNIDKTMLGRITNELYTNKEIGNHNLYNVNGIYATQLGATSFQNKVYLNRNKTFIINSLKDLVQILVPVISLLTTFYVIQTKDKESYAFRKELELTKQELINIKSHIREIEIKSQHNNLDHYTINDLDSLKTSSFDSINIKLDK